MPGLGSRHRGDAALSDRPLVFASNAPAGALIVGRSCDSAASPWTPRPFSAAHAAGVPAPCGRRGAKLGAFLGRQNQRERSSFREYPAKRVVLSLGDSPARPTSASASPRRALKKIGADWRALRHGIGSVDLQPYARSGGQREASHEAHTPSAQPIDQRLAPGKLRPSQPVNTECSVLSTSGGNPSIGLNRPRFHITLNSSHDPEFHIRTLLGKPSARNFVLLYSHHLSQEQNQYD